MVIAKNGVLKVKTGRAVTFVVAASNSEHKDEADYICDGVDDQVEIQAAIDALPTDGGKVVLLDGSYDVKSGITIGEKDTLSGMGFGSVIKLNKTNTLGSGLAIITVYGVCENLCLDGNAWTDQDIDTNGVRIEDYGLLSRCEIREVRQYAVWGYSSTKGRIINNIIHHTKYPIALSGGAESAGFSNGFLISGNVCYEYDFYLKFCRTKNNLIVNNIVFRTHADGGGIIVHGGDGGPSFNLDIANNIVVDMLGTGQTVGIELVDDPGLLTKGILVSGNNVVGFYRGISCCSRAKIIANSVMSCSYSGIRLDRASKSDVSNNITDSGIIVDSSSHCFISGNVIEGGVPYYRADDSGIFIWGAHLSSSNVVIENNKIFDCIGHGVYISDETEPVGKIWVNGNHFYDNGGKSIEIVSAGTVFMYDVHIDQYTDVRAISETHVRSNEDLSVATPITFTLDAQPDVPRTLSAHFDTHANITEYDIEIIGVDAKGNTVTETRDETDGWDWETNNAFATITSIKMTARTGTGVGDTMDIGITDVLGLSNLFYETGDVFKIKKNNANVVVAGAQVNATYHTYDMSVIGLAATDDFTIWYKSNLNIIS